LTTPTTDIDESAPRISGKPELVEWFEVGSKPKEDWRIGTEHEKFGFLHDGLKPLPYEGEASVRAMLEGLRDQFGWNPIEEGGHLIGLKKDGASVSLEPGGQFELSGAPLEHIHQTCDEVGAHLEEVRKIADPLGIGFLGLGASPLWSMDETPIMPKGRYKIMRAYMDKVGRLGRQMMFRTCTVQSNLDYGSEADMVKKFRVSLALQPLGTALFANSPFLEGRPNGFLMYFVRRKGEYLDASGLSFRDFMDGKLPILPGEKPAIDDFEDHLSTIFPEVRLKRFLEMRGSDAGPWSRLCAFSAFWTGILYDDAALDAAWHLVKDWTAGDREAIRQASRTIGLQTPIPGGRTLQDLAKDVVAISRQGLNARGKLSKAGDNESGFLSELDQIANSGRTPAEALLVKYHKDWGGDVRHVFKELAY